MRSLTPATTDLFRRLRDRTPGQHAALVPADHRDIQDLSDVRELSALPELIGHLNDDARIAAAASTAIDQIMRSCDALTLGRLESELRHLSEWRLPSASQTEWVAQFSGSAGVLGLLSFAGNGYVREAAVRALAKLSDGEELRYLLIRLNDWVTPVREAARLGVMERIRIQFAGHFVRAFPLVARLQLQSRAEHRAVLESINVLMRREECREALRAGLSDPVVATRRAIFSLLSTLEMSGAEVFADAMNSSDTVLRFGAARELTRRLEGSKLREALERLKLDRFMPVRREALRAYAERLPDEAAAELRAALLDPHISMRETARFYLRKLAPSDFAHFYRERLANREALAPAISGLGETGLKEDAEKLLPLLGSADPRVRKAAVQSIARLDPEGRAEALFESLNDESPLVVRAARRVFHGRPGLLQATALWTLFESSRLGHVRRAALGLIGELRWWEGAPLLVHAAGVGDEELKAIAIGFLNRWRSNAMRLTARPSLVQLSLLERALNDRTGDLTTEICSDVRQVIADARRMHVDKS